MIIVKYICLIFIFLTSSQIGLIKSQNFKKRVEELNKIESSFNLFKTKIEYTNDVIEDIFSQISLIIYSNRTNIFFNTINKKENKKLFESWSSSLEENLYLKEDDKELLKIFGKNLGKLDKKGQVFQLDEIISLIKKQIQKAEEDVKKNEKMYKSLGSIIGAIIVIILI